MAGGVIWVGVGDEEWLTLAIPGIIRDTTGEALNNTGIEDNIILIRYYSVLSRIIPRSNILHEIAS